MPLLWTLLWMSVTGADVSERAMSMTITLHVDAQGAGRLELSMGGDGIDPTHPGKRVPSMPAFSQDLAKAWAEQMGPGAKLVRYQRQPRKNGGLYETMVVEIADFNHFELAQPKATDAPLHTQFRKLPDGHGLLSVFPSHARQRISTIAPGTPAALAFGSIRFGIYVDVEGKVVRTDAPAAAGARVTIGEMDTAPLVTTADGCQLLMAVMNNELETARPLLPKFPQVKQTLKVPIEIEIAPAK